MAKHDKPAAPPSPTAHTLFPGVSAEAKARFYRTWSAEARHAPQPTDMRLQQPPPVLLATAPEPEAEPPVRETHSTHAKTRKEASDGD